MARISPAAAHHRAKIASISRCIAAGERPVNDPELLNARRGLAAATWSDRIKRLVDESPPLCREDLEQIATLLRMRVVE
jgi:hypothetical protein